MKQGRLICETTLPKLTVTLNSLACSTISLLASKLQGEFHAMGRASLVSISGRIDQVTTPEICSIIWHKAWQQFAKVENKITLIYPIKLKEDCVKCSDRKSCFPFIYIGKVHWLTNQTYA